MRELECFFDCTKNSWAPLPISPLLLKLQTMSYFPLTFSSILHKARRKSTPSSHFSGQKTIYFSYHSEPGAN